MTILLDESVPRLLQIHLGEFSIVTVHELEWTGMKNGELLEAANKQFTIFLTADKHLRYQPNPSGNLLSIIVLPTNQVPLVLTLLPLIRDTILAIQPNELIEISLP